MNLIEMLRNTITTSKVSEHNISKSIYSVDVIQLACYIANYCYTRNIYLDYYKLHAITYVAYLYCLNNHMIDKAEIIRIKHNGFRIKELLDLTDNLPQKELIQILSNHFNQQWLDSYKDEYLQFIQNCIKYYCKFTVEMLKNIHAFYYTMDTIKILCRQ